MNSNYELVKELQEKNSELMNKISELEEYKKNYLEMEDNYLRLTDSISDCFAELTPDFLIRYANAELAKLLAHPSEELINKSIFRYFPLLDDIIDRGEVKEISSTDKKKSLSYKVVDEAEEKAYQIKLFPFSNGVYFFARDITEELQRDEELRVYVEELQMNKDIFEQNTGELAILNAKLEESEEKLQELNIMKDKLYSVLAFDFRNTLNALLGFSDLVTTKFSELSSNEVIDFVNHIDTTSKTLRTLFEKSSELFENLIYWSQYQIGRLEVKNEEFDLAELAKTIVEGYQKSIEEKKLSIVAEIGVNKIINADRDIVRVVLKNLLSNAIKFTGEGGEIKISLEEVNDSYTISVIDNGIGMSEEDQSEVFKMSFRKKPSGDGNEKMGIGLLLSKGLAEKCNGDIFVESELSRGSSFIFSIPKQ